MADPFSIFAGVLAAGTAALQTAKAVSSLVDTVKVAPSEITGIIQDVKQFEVVLSSLRSTLESIEVQKVVAANAHLTELVSNLRGPIQSCSTTLAQLALKLRPHARSFDGHNGNNGTRSTTARMRWALGARKDVLNTADRLFHDKLTLDTSMTAVCVFCNIRATVINPGVRQRRISIDTDAGFAIKRYFDVVSTGGSQHPSSIVDSISTLRGVGQLQDRSIAPQEPTTADLMIKLRIAGDRRQQLFEAAESGDATTLEILAIAGEDVNAKTLHGRTPLYLAAENGHEAVVAVLLKHGADVHSRTACPVDLEGHYQAHGTIPLHVAATAGVESIIKLLLDAGSDVTASNPANRTPYIGALVDAASECGWTPLHEACSYGFYDKAMILINHGAKIDPISDITDDISPSGTASSEIQGECSQRTPLLVATQWNCLSIVRLLVEKGANIDFRNTSGETALHVAAWNGFNPIARYLLDKGANIEVKDEYSDETPLHKAVEKKQVAVVNSLLARGARIDPINHVGHDVLQHAELISAGDIIRLIKQHIEQRAKLATDMSQKK
ncbi:uncharacterized protein KY384_000164 [Bacidia gigantensis]|uniref:uncharacterized protein n=1 Tax=Bacidia gigantensis TaxID=2732470 RepID=UPI001D04B9A8|nr:uncharacterized protein KY384_000164 [Bacidia gigantensis]KAG8526171.1 hypothetical protein KY384_000164 [Bacidia gigantensis]